MHFRCFALFLLTAAPVSADEGMWTFDNPPLARLKEVYAFTPTPAWLDKVRLASVRFNDGGSGSFVSPDGLMITNHHVGMACIQNLSSAETDYVSSGYLAPSRGKEPACPGYEVDVLMSTEDVSARVLGAVKPAMSDKEAGEARKAAIASVETECAARTGLRCDVVTLYQGSEYQRTATRNIRTCGSSSRPRCRPRSSGAMTTTSRFPGTAWTLPSSVRMRTAGR